MPTERWNQIFPSVFIFFIAAVTCLEAFTHRSAIGHGRDTPSRRYLPCFESANGAEHESRGMLLEQKFSNRSLQKCSVSFVEPQSGCEVTLVGCFHGSPSSAQDVRETLAHRPPDVLVLELCPDRFLSIQEQLRKKEVALVPMKAHRHKRTTTDWAIRGVDGVLRLVNRAQTAFFSGLTPGLEFVTALECCPGTDVVLADQPVHETLRKLSQLPRIAVQSLRRSSPLRETQALGMALFGSKEHVSVNVFDFGTRHWDAQKELFQWILVPMSAFSLPIVGLAAIGSNGPALPTAELSSNPELVTWASSSFAVVNVLLILLCYLGLVLPATRVVLHERDAVLAAGILAACELALGDGDKKGANVDAKNRPPARVTAVVGLLHVNGVAWRLVNGEP